MCRRVLVPHLVRLFLMVPLFLTDRRFLMGQQFLEYLEVLMFPRVLVPHLLPLFLTVQRSLMDRLPLRDLMFLTALLVLGPRWLRLFLMGQPLLWDPRCRLVLLVLGPHLHLRCRRDLLHP
jgi:hypothetical protein